MRLLFAVLGMSFSVSVLTIKPAFAYLDPGTGSMILQGIIGGVAAGITVISLYYQRLKLFLSQLFGKRKADSDQSSK